MLKINKIKVFRSLILIFPILFVANTEAMQEIPAKHQNIYNIFSVLKNPVYYVVVNNPPSLSMSDVRETMCEAFQTWSVITFGRGSKIEELPPSDNNSSFFTVSFESGKHWSFLFSQAFSKEGAGFATKFGYIYFNKDIKWKKYKIGEKVDDESNDFYSVALFTVGQWIGFNASENETSIMYSGYRKPADANGNYVKPVFSEYDWKQSYSSSWKPDYPIYNYTILNNPPTLSMTNVRETIAKAFNTWTLLYPDFKFQEVPFSDVDCQVNCTKFKTQVSNISFESGKHRDLYFDVTFNQKQAGHALDFALIHFNKDIQWRIYKVGEKVDNKSTDFYSIALFTVGQFIGWESSKNETSIMYEGYKDPVDENGNYVEPMFSEYDFNYADEIIVRNIEYVHSEDEAQKIYEGLYIKYMGKQNNTSV